MDLKRKLVVVGDGACGKTSLLIVFSGEPFSEEYVPTVFEHRIVDVKCDNKLIELSLWDTAGQEDYDRLRPLSYNEADVVLICFSVVDPDSFENVQEKWFNEVNHLAPEVKIILVGCKTDLRQDPKVLNNLKLMKKSLIQLAQGEHVAQTYGAYKYLECSSKTGEGVHKVFEHATRATLLLKKKKKKSGCLVL